MPSATRSSRGGIWPPSTSLDRSLVIARLRTATEECTRNAVKGLLPREYMPLARKLFNAGQLYEAHDDFAGAFLKYTQADM
jgi:hypothetical protein